MTAGLLFVIGVVKPVGVRVTAPKVGTVPGTPGVTAAEAALTGLVPLDDSAWTRKVYAVPLVRPVTVAVRLVETPSLKGVQLVPSVEYETA